jgi:hypothetical protein
MSTGDNELNYDALMYEVSRITFKSLENVFLSQNINGMSINVTDGLFAIAEAIDRLAEAISESKKG